MKILEKIFLWCAIISVPFVSARAGERTTVRGVGMGRTFVAASRGIDAIGINPANLAVPDRSPFSLVLLPFTYRLSTELFSYDIYKDFFTGIPDTNGDGKREPKLLTGEDKERILSLLPEGKGTTRMDVEVMALGLSYQNSVVGGIGLSVSDHMGIRLDLAKEFFRLFLNGFPEGGSMYDFTGTSFSAWWWREYNFSYARRLPLRRTIFWKSVYAGIGLKMVHGYGVLLTDRYNASIGNRRVGTNQYVAHASFDFLTTRSGVDFLDPQKQTSPNPLANPAGTGLGADIGATIELNNGVILSLALTDIGSIRWKKNIVETSGNYSLTIDDPFSAAGQDTLQDAIKGKNRSGEEFQTPLPTVIRVGALLESRKVSFLKFLPGAMMLAVDFNKGINESLGNTKQSRLSVGMEYRIIPMIPLRTGLSVGGGDGLRWGAGLGLDFHYLSLDLASENFGMLFNPSAFQMFSLSMGLKIRL
jgi:hypothetical protein